ncbi:MAG: sugar nucleotide-binding protein [Ignavibacteriota bacterium]
MHYSTNYVFDGVQGEYDESAVPAPLSIYGRSKWGGEQRIGEVAGAGYVLRTAVIFGPKGASDLSKKSFVDLMRDLSAKRDTIQAVSDEINSVTYAPDLAAATQALLDRQPAPGIYHVTNSGSASWYDLAAEIFRLTGKDDQSPAPSPRRIFPRKAQRPLEGDPTDNKIAGAPFVARGAARVPQRVALPRAFQALRR